MSIKIRQDGQWVEVASGSGSPYPSGQIIKTGSYSTGYGAGNSTVINSTYYTTVKLDGNRQTAFNITRGSNGVFDFGNSEALMFNKISNNSDLEVTIYFPAYMSGNTGCGIRCVGRWNQDQETDYNGSNIWAPLSSLNEGPFDAWGAHGYGTAAAGAMIYSWNTREAEMGYSLSNPDGLYAAEYKFWDKTGLIELKFEAAMYNTNGTLYIGSYDNADGSYSEMIGKVIVREIAR